MDRQALGLIESVGLIGAIEAADAAAKAAAVVLVKSELTDGSLVTIHIEGELGAVQAAVEAGVAACEKVGRVLTHTVIPRPDGLLSVILDSKKGLKGFKRPTAIVRGSTTESQSRQDRSPAGTANPAGPMAHTRRPSEYDRMTVSALRSLARRRGNLPISGREIAHADKDALIRLLTEADG